MSDLTSGTNKSQAVTCSSGLAMVAPRSTRYTLHEGTGVVGDLRRGMFMPDGQWVGYPEGTGEFLLREDDDTFQQRRRYPRALMVIGVVAGTLLSASGLFLAFALFEDPLSDEATESGLPWLTGGGFVLALMAVISTNRNCNKWRMAFFTGGILLVVPQPWRRWEMLLVPWDEMWSCRHVDHWFLGPSLVVAFGGQRLVVPESMEGFGQVADAVRTNVR